jgi:hypothetical protein
MKTKKYSLHLEKIKQNKQNQTCPVSGGGGAKET